MEEIKLTPEEASQRLSNGAFMLCMGVPAAVEFGCDTAVWEVGPNFKGLKMIPPGIHLAIYGAGHGTRYGEYINVKPGDVLIRVWDPKQEEFAAGSGLTEDEAERYVAGVHRQDFDGQMGPYPPSVEKAWADISNYITTEILARCGISPGVRIAAGDPEAVEPGEDTGAGKGDLQTRFPDSARVCRFTPLWPEGRTRERGRRPEGKTAAEITEYNMDASKRLSEIVAQKCGGDWKLLVGELQVAFVLFLMLHSYSALLNWKELVHLVCFAESALTEVPELFSKFIVILQSQLQLVPQDFFVDELASDNFLRPCLSRLMSGIKLAAEAPIFAAATTDLEDASSAPAPPASGARRHEDAAGLLKQVKKLRKFLLKRFDLDLEEDAEVDEDTPVVVEYTHEESEGMSAGQASQPDSGDGTFMDLTAEGGIVLGMTSEDCGEWVGMGDIPMDTDGSVSQPSGPMPAAERMGWMLG
ncbi:hypothetical protein CYMTET_50086 [Cymbomonas tetramitiformis]|uniref:AAR2 protein n=1 Tax=Cymbomonas tetramitiformis TaxID=36881 RepID=A0AAE0BNW9_9CHLO|nr:hypothetical protein CYMTET_53410 [Cymbomonas tetramitiformis]KAK3240031.1 hypothetical protein CYMTET_50086 [Cymbomonas tetramitiformis]